MGRANSHTIVDILVLCLRRRSQVVKARVCKTLIRRFESARRLQIDYYVIDGKHSESVSWFKGKGRSKAPYFATAYDSLESLPRGRGGGMVDAPDLKSVASDGVWVRLPPSAPQI